MSSALLDEYEAQFGLDVSGIARKLDDIPEDDGMYRLLVFGGEIWTDFEI
jgi:hypothetical protein